MSQAKVTGRKRAVEVVLVRTGKEKREQEQLQKVMTGRINNSIVKVDSL